MKKNLLILILLLFTVISLVSYYGLLGSNSIQSESTGNRNKQLSVKLDNFFKQVLKNNIEVVVSVSDDGEAPASTKKIDSDKFSLNFVSSYYFTNKENINALNVDLLKKTLTHELGHILSLEDSQFKEKVLLNLSKEDFQIKEKVCNPNYFSVYGCFADDSYINTFYQKYWNGELLERYNDLQNLEDTEQAIKDKSKWDDDFDSNFVSTTAKVSPEEDLAESFSLWVVGYNEKNFTPKQLEKINFFNNFQQLEDIKFNVTYELNRF
jgi:hypothetical protein